MAIIVTWKLRVTLDSGHHLPFLFLDSTDCSVPLESGLVFQKGGPKSGCEATPGDQNPIVYPIPSLDDIVTFDQYWLHWPKASFAILPNWRKKNIQVLHQFMDNIHGQLVQDKSADWNGLHFPGLNHFGSFWPPATEELTEVNVVKNQKQDQHH